MTISAIDLFAGLGGFTEASRQAGVNVVWAANHWKLAVDFHQANHPSVVHECQDLHQANWAQVPTHDLLLASPACTGHTHARGKEQAHHDAARSTAWAVVSCTEVHRPQACIVENVPEFLNWRLYPSWKLAMETLGYAVSPHVVDCADLGVPKHRELVFIVCTQSKAPIQLNIPKRDHIPANDITEWDVHRWSAIAKPGRAQATLNRVQRGRSQFGDRFVMPYYKSGSGLTGRCLSRPIGTITTVDRWAIVDGQKMRMFQPSEYRKGMTFPNHYQLPKKKRDAVKMLGNAVPPVAAAQIIRATLEAA